MNVWKRVLCVVALCALPALAFGFDFGFGFKAGMNFPYWGGVGFDESLLLPDSEGFIMTVGFPGGIPAARFCFSAGAFVELGIFKLFSIQPEVLYSMLGGGYTTVQAGEEVRCYSHGSAIEVPILFKLRLFTTKGTGISLFLGPDVMFPLASQHAERYEDGSEYAGEVIWIYKDPFFRGLVLFGAIGGIGIHFSNGAFIEGRYSLGAFMANENFDWSTFSLNTLDPANRTWRQNNIQVMIGFEL